MGRMLRFVNDRLSLMTKGILRGMEYIEPPFNNQDSLHRSLPGSLPLARDHLQEGQAPLVRPRPHLLDRRLYRRRRRPLP